VYRARDLQAQGLIEIRNLTDQWLGLSKSVKRLVEEHGKLVTDLLQSGEGWDCAMLDEEWLSQLCFKAIQNIEVNGLAGIGSNLVVLKGTMSNGKQIVIKIPKTNIAFHIREVPPHLSLNPEYDFGSR
jgi:hypothetical protein